MNISYDRLASRIDEIIYELELINSDLNNLRKRICYLENESKSTKGYE